MRIRTLAFRGIGPYRDVQSIDFDQLGASGLYLINGPTGAGKSTIIDAITFALYGKLSSAEADESRLRSDFAGPTDPTEVDLTFDTAAGTFRVIRSPKYLRAAKRGSGTTEEKGGCHVFRVHPDGREETIAEAKGAADAELARLIGLTREQFVQTVVLPQGQFATFLYSDTKDRAEILKRIFNTQLFERVVEILKADAAQAQAASAATTHEIRSEMATLATLIDLDADEVAALQELATQSLDEALLANLESRAPALQEQAAAAGERAQALRAAMATADDARTLARDEAAADSAVASAQATWENALLAVTESRASLDLMSTLAESLHVPLDDATEAEIWRTRQSTVDGHLGALAALASDECTLTSWPQEKAAAEQELQGLREAQAIDTDRLAELPDLIDARQHISAARPTLHEIASVSDRRAAVTAAQTILRDLTSEEQAAVEWEAKAATALAAADRADREYEAASRGYREAIAAHLSSELSPGTPCPVCGAAEHPAPAQHAGTPVSAEDVEGVREAAREAHVVLSRMTTALDECRQRISTLRDSLRCEPDRLTDEDMAVSVLESELRSRSESAERAEADLEELRREQQDLLTRTGTYASALAEKSAELATRAQQIQQMETRVLDARGDFPTIEERRIASTSLSAALADMARCCDERARAHAAVSKAETARAAWPEREGFADVDAAQSAWEECQAAFLLADQERRDAEARLQHLRQRITTITELITARATTVAESRDLVLLADLFSSGRGRDIGLHIYVLKSLFANVMESANRRFETLLNGRYRLVPAQDDEGDGRSLQGLGVSVEDRLTGRVRPARSLSGGETFCASLALALGLSDVVRMTAGGIEINSLFIDEGFGSLDGDQLDEVMVMLGHLSSGGRRVGVISHVDSMKSTITERIDITPATETRPAFLQVSWMDAATT